MSKPCSYPFNILLHGVAQINLSQLSSIMKLSYLIRICLFISLSVLASCGKDTTYVLPDGTDPNSIPGGTNGGGTGGGTGGSTGGGGIQINPPTP